MDGSSSTLRRAAPSWSSRSQRWCRTRCTPRGHHGSRLGGFLASLTPPGHAIARCYGMILRYGAYVNVATARARVGGRIDVRRPATPLLVHNGRVTGAETPRGTVETATLVQSAGAWTNPLLRRLDRRVPPPHPRGRRRACAELKPLKRVRLSYPTAEARGLHVLFP